MLYAWLFSLQVLSAAQLEALGPDNAAMVTTEQRNLLNNDQLDTLETALTGFRKQAQGAVQSGKNTNLHKFGLF